MSLVLVRWLEVFWRALTTIGQTLAKFFQPILRLFVNIFILSTYRLSFRISRIFKNWWPKLPSIKLLSHHQSIIYLLLIAAVLVTANSWRVHQAAAEDFGQNNLLFPLIKPDFELLVTETGAGLIPETDPEFAGTDDIAADEFPETQLGLSGSDGAILKPHLVTSSPGTAARTKIEYYEVEEGDTISDIAERFGLNVNTLLWENRLTARSLIRPGQKLTILPTDGVTYRIGSGDTVNKIAKRYGVSSDNIMAYNNLSSASLTVGQTIVIPGGRPPASPVVTRPSASSSGSSGSSTPPITSGKLLWPVASTRITQYYSWRHGGIDIGAPTGTSIFAAEGGIVEVSGWNSGGYGYYIIIDHGGGLKTLYGHSSKLLVAAGDRVEKGDHIANVGSTGRSTGPHLHFEIRIRGSRTNPLNYIR